MIYDEGSQLHAHLNPTTHRLNPFNMPVWFSEFGDREVPEL